MSETLLWLGNQETHEAYRATPDKAHAHPRFSADAPKGAKSSSAPKK